MIQMILHRSELLVLLDALHVGALVGLPLQQLLPPSREAHQEALVQGQERLAQRGLLRRESDGTCKLDGTLLLMASVLAFPQLVALTTRRDRAGHTWHWLHLYSDGLVVEHTQPDGQQHQLVTLPSPAALTARLLDLWPAPLGQVPVSCVLPAEALAALVEALDAGRDDEAQQLVQLHDLPPPVRGLLLNTLSSRRFSGSTALLRCAGETVTDARNPGFIVGAQATWLVAPTFPGSSLLRLESLTGPQLQQQLTTWMQALYPLQRAA